MPVIDVRVSQGGTIVGGEVRVDAAVVARCTLCGHDVESAASLEKGTFAFPTAATTELAITTTQLAMILGGVELTKTRTRTRFQQPDHSSRMPR